MELLHKEQQTHQAALSELKERAHAKEVASASEVEKIRTKAAAQLSAGLAKAQAAHDEEMAAAREHSDKLIVALQEMKALADANAAAARQDVADEDQ